MKNKISLGIGILLLAVMLSSFVSAFAVSSVYYDENPLKMHAGQTREITFLVQNRGEDVNLVVTLEKGSEIMEMINVEPEEIYFIPLGENKEVTARVTVSEDASIGETYPIQVQFLGKEDPAGGFGFQSSITKKFNVEVVEKIVPVPEEPELADVAPGIPGYIYILAIVVIVIIVIIVIIIFIKKKKK